MLSRIPVITALDNQQCHHKAHVMKCISLLESWSKKQACATRLLGCWMFESSRLKLTIRRYALQVRAWFETQQWRLGVSDFLHKGGSETSHCCKIKFVPGCFFLALWPSWKCSSKSCWRFWCPNYNSPPSDSAGSDSSCTSIFLFFLLLPRLNDCSGSSCGACCWYSWFFLPILSNDGWGTTASDSVSLFGQEQ